MSRQSSLTRTNGQYPARLIPQALGPSATQVARVSADIAACAASDALIDAEDAMAELRTRLQDIRNMKPATAALIFGSEAAWRQALARLGVAAGAQTGLVEKLRIAAQQSPGFSLAEVESRTTRGYTGD